MIYLDNSATTRTLPAAAETAMRYMTDDFFNPAAAYSPAVAAERAINSARVAVSRVINANPDEIIFTSGGTESNNMAFMGGLGAMRNVGEVIVGAAEHPSVFETAKVYAAEEKVLTAPVDSTGKVDTDALSSLLRPETSFVSVMQVNNETGAINDIPAIYRLMKSKSPLALLHVDGVQGYLKVPFEARFCDMYSLSGHKFHAPKGVGALFVRNGMKFAGGQHGGGQEKNLRSGTSNTPGIMGMAAAVSDYSTHINEYRQRMYECKKRLSDNLLAIPDTVCNGPSVEKGAPHILNVSFLGVRGEVLLHALEEKGVYVSTGSACSAHKAGKNRILSAMGITGERLEGAIRLSLCPENTLDEMDLAAEAVSAVLSLLRRFKRR